MVTMFDISLPSDDKNKNHLVAKHSTFFPWNVQNFFNEKGRKETTQKVLYFPYHLGDSFFLWRIYDVNGVCNQLAISTTTPPSPPPPPAI